MDKYATEKYVELIINSLNFNKLIPKLLNIIKDTASDQQISIQRLFAMRHALYLWISILF